MRGGRRGGLSLRAGGMKLLRTKTSDYFQGRLLQSRRRLQRERTPRGSGSRPRGSSRSSRDMPNLLSHNPNTSIAPQLGIELSSPSHMEDNQVEISTMPEPAASLRLQSPALPASLLGLLPMKCCFERFRTRALTLAPRSHRLHGPYIRESWLGTVGAPYARRTPRSVSSFFAS